MPKRLNAVWSYETGYYTGDPISEDQNMNLKNNFEIEFFKNEKSASFYILGCYFGELYLLEKESLKYTRYIIF